jgi:hypothetical protein
LCNRADIPIPSWVFVSPSVPPRGCFSFHYQSRPRTSTAGLRPLTQLWSSLGTTQVVQPETILRWHRAGFKAFWRWKSRERGRRPKIDRGLRNLIRRMGRENSKWGHPGSAAASCHREIGFAGGTTLPRQDHHTHTPLQGAIRWRLIVWADHNPK